MKIKRIVLVVFVIGVVSAIGFYYYANRPVSDTTDQVADVTISATGLMSAYENNEKEADSLYLGKILEVAGVISSVDTAAKVVTMETESMMGTVSCEFPADAATMLSGLAKGNSIIIKGECAGFLMDVVMKRSSVVHREL